MGLQQPHRSIFYDLPTTPPSTPLSLPPLPPLASTVNIQITNHNHYSIQTPPDSANYNFGAKNQSHWKTLATTTTTTTTTSQKVQYRSPLLQRLIQGLSPVYGLLTPAATPLQRTSTVTLTGEDSPSVKQSSHAEQTAERRQDITATIFQDTTPSSPQDMPIPSQIRFSASAGNRDFAARSFENEDLLSSPQTAIQPGDDTVFSEDSLAEVFALRSGKGKSEQTQQKRKKKETRTIPKCHDHDLRLPDVDPGVDVVPCDWVRPFNSSRWNNYTNGDVQCKVPKCDTCISHETYGAKSIWALSAPKGHTAESHRLRSRIRYLCSRCPQPAPPPPGGIGPIEMCTCVLRDADGIPTDMWFQCKGCAESAWLEHDSKFGGPDGALVTRRARRRKNKYGIVVRPRMTKDARRQKAMRLKRCVCGKIAPKDGRYGAWCTWCQCPVAGKDMMELGGAATRSGRAFLPKKEEETEETEETEDDKTREQKDETMDDANHDEKEDEEMAYYDGDCDSGIVVFE